jgi:hypothetical protein
MEPFVHPEICTPQGVKIGMGPMTKPGSPKKALKMPLS